MSGYKKLIFAIFLSGCATQAADAPVNLIKKTTEEPTTSVDLNTDLLESVESTLDIADGAINEIVREKTKNRNKISSLKTLVDKEEELISTLEESLTVKDSVLVAYQENTELLEVKINTVKEELDHAIHKCTTQCYPMIMGLKKTNTRLLDSIGSLEAKILYLDSLIATNKKLSKKI